MLTGLPIKAMGFPLYFVLSQENLKYPIRMARLLKRVLIG